MPFISINSLRYFYFDHFSSYDLVHGLFSRHGGVSPNPWASLNLGGTVGDDRPRVLENRRRVFSALGRKVESIFDVWQVHGTNVVCSSFPRPLDAPHIKADAILTNSEDVTLCMLFADCVPILFYDPVKRIVGIAHAGWQGTVKKIVQVVVEKMRNEYDCQPKNILAGIGPSIGPDHYEVGQDVIDRVYDAFGSASKSFLETRDGKIYFDLWKTNQFLLEQAGVRNIQNAEICTACHRDDWYSHRGDKGKTGRYGALITLGKRD